MRCRSYLLGIALLFAALPLQAADSLATAPTTLDPARAYVLVRIGERVPGALNLLMLSPYDDLAQDLRGRGRAKDNPVPRGADERVLVGRDKPLEGGAHLTTYLVAVTPGLYVLSNTQTTCFCLGSYQFEAAAGRIIDLGTVYFGPENGTSPWAVLARLRSSPDIEDTPYTVADAIAVYPFKEGMSVPQSVVALPRESAAYLPAPRFGNHYGRLVNKALPLGGGQ
jgi:hypothetical protein